MAEGKINSADQAVDPAVFDAYSPDRIALGNEVAGISKGTLPTGPTVTLAFLAGAFIALGATFYLVTISAFVALSYYLA